MEIVDLCERQRATITCGLSFYNYDLFTQNLLYSDSWNLFCKRVFIMQILLVLFSSFKNIFDYFNVEDIHFILF